MIIPILIFDKDLNYIGQIDDYEYFSWKRKWRDPDEWNFLINRYKHNVNQLADDAFISIFIGGKYRIGKIGQKELQLDENGKLSENLKVSGRDISGIFMDRLSLVGVQGQTLGGYDTQTDIAENVMRHYVNANCIDPSDTNRIVPHLILGTNLARGPQMEVRARFQPISELLNSISLFSNLGYEVIFDLENKQFVFNVLEGKDLSSGQTINPPVIFSPDFDNIEMLGYRFSQVDSKTYAIVGGQGEANEREIENVTQGTPTGFDRREVFIDARDLDSSTQLQQRGNERLAELADVITMEAEALQQGPFTYLMDYDLGDIVTVNYPEIVQMDTRIVEVLEEITVERGSIQTLTFGKEFPDIKNVLRSYKKNTENEVRK